MSDINISIIDREGETQVAITIAQAYTARELI